MKLNLYFVQEDLPELQFEGTPIDPPTVARCRIAQFVDDLPGHLDEGVMYVASASTLALHPPKSTKASFLCLGPAPKAWREAALNLLHSEADVEPVEVMNAVIRLFDRYRMWEEDLHALVDQHMPIDMLGARSAAIFGNPVIAQDVSYRPFFYALPSAGEETEAFRIYREEVYGQHVGEGGLSVPRKTAMAFNQNSDFAKLESVEDPVLFTGDTWSKLSVHSLSFRSLLYNCRVNGTLLARVIVDDIVQPFRKKDYVLVKVLGDCLTRGLQTAGIGDAGQSTRFVRICQSLLSGGTVSDDRIVSVMEKLGWRDDDRFFCIVLRERKLDRKFSAIARVAIAVTAHDDSRQHCFFDGRALVVCDLSAGAHTRDEVINDVLRNVRDLGAIASFSSSFSGFGNLVHFYRQALVVERVGRIKDVSSEAYRFEDYAVDYLIARCEEGSTVDAIIPDGVRKLIELDKERGTRDAHLLRTFLDKDRNMAKTVRELYIHRSTLLYRLEKIKEALNTDLDDPDVRLSVQIALRALRVSADAPYGE